MLSEEGLKHNLGSQRKKKTTKQTNKQTNKQTKQNKTIKSRNIGQV